MNWLLITINLLGGLSVFLFGMNLMSEGINKSTGAGIRKLLRGFTKNRFSALLTGIISTTILQSSSAVSVMTIGFVKARVMKFPQTIGILLGAGIGTTITAQIIAFKLSDYALLIVAAGFFLSIVSKKTTLKLAGSALLGFGLLFFGLHLMSNAMMPLREYQPFIDVLVTLRNPVLGMLAGMIFTALIQSSSAFIGILIVLGSQGIISLETAIAMLLGSNIGTTATALIASLNAGYESKRVAVAFFMIKLLGVIIVLPWISSYASWIISFTSSAMDVSGANPLPRQIANAHTVFNLLVTIILIPFTGSMATLISRIIPEKHHEVDAPVQLQYIDNKMIDTPSVALTLAKNETLHMAKIVLSMLDNIAKAFLTRDERSLHEIEKDGIKTDFLRRNISDYVTSVSRQNLSEGLSRESFQLLYIISELDEIEHEIAGNLLQRGKFWVKGDAFFSDSGKNELVTFFEQTKKHFQQVLRVVEVVDKSEAGRLEEEHRRIRVEADRLKRNHFLRVSRNISESIATSEVHLEITGSLRIIHSHLADIVRVLAREVK